MKENNSALSQNVQQLIQLSQNVSPQSKSATSLRRNQSFLKNQLKTGSQIQEFPHKRGLTSIPFSKIKQSRATAPIISFNDIEDTKFHSPGKGYPNNNKNSNSSTSSHNAKLHSFTSYQLISQILTGMISLYISFLYISQTYIDDQTLGLLVAQYLAIPLIIFDYINSMAVISQSKLKFIFSFSSLGDIVNIVLIICKVRPCIGFLRFTQFSNFVSYVRTWRLIYSQTNYNERMKPSQILIWSQFVVLVVNVISFFLISASIFLVLNRYSPKYFAISNPDSSNKFTIVSALYFTMITVTTLGYGDYYPDAPLTRMLNSLFFITAVVWLTLITQQISQLYKQRGRYLSQFNARKKIKHVIIAGHDLSSLKLRGFLRQFFHPDHGSIKDTKAVIILDKKPQADMREILNEYSQNIHIILGDFFDDTILQKSQIKKAEAAFLLSSARATQTLNADMFVVLASKKATLVKPTIKINAQINSKNFTLHGWCDWSNVYSIQEFKMGILAANAFNPGFCPMILNLLRSSSRYEFKKQKPWVLEYNQGLQHEIYLIPGRYCQEISFQQLVKNAYESKGALVIGVKNRESRSSTMRRNATVILNHQNESKKNVWLNPTNHRILPSDQIIVLAKDSQHARDAVQNANKMWKGCSLSSSTRFRRGSVPIARSQVFRKSKNILNSFNQPPKKTKTSPIFNETDNKNSNSQNLQLPQEKAFISDKDFMNQEDLDAELLGENYFKKDKEKLTMDDLKVCKNYNYMMPKKLPNHYFPIWKSYVKGLSDHILIFGQVQAVASLIDILCLFTSNYICYVSDHPMGKSWSQQMANKPRNILYFECSYNNPKELKKTGIENAQHVIVLSWILQGSNSHDSGMLQVIRTIEEFFPDVKYTIQLVDEGNIKFIGGHKEDMKLPLTCKSVFASGKLLYTSILEAIVAQIYYNDSILSIINKLIFADLKTSASISHNNFENSKLNYIAIKSEAMVGVIKYSQLFRALIQKGVVPIALYRAKDDYLQNVERYIVTNPDRQIILLKNDIVLVLGDTYQSKQNRMFQQQKSLNSSYIRKLNQQQEAFENQPENQDIESEQPQQSPQESFKRNVEFKQSKNSLLNESLNDLENSKRIIQRRKVFQEKKGPQRFQVSQLSYTTEQFPEIPNQVSHDTHVSQKQEEKKTVNTSKIVEINEINLLQVKRPPQLANLDSDRPLSFVPTFHSNQDENIMTVPKIVLTPHNQKDQEEKAQSQTSQDYNHLDDQRLLQLIGEQLALSQKQRYLLSEQEQILQKIKRIRVMDKVKYFISKLKQKVKQRKQNQLKIYQSNQHGKRVFSQILSLGSKQDENFEDATKSAVIRSPVNSGESLFYSDDGCLVELGNEFVPIDKGFNESSSNQINVSSITQQFRLPYRQLAKLQGVAKNKENQIRASKEILNKSNIN